MHKAAIDLETLKLTNLPNRQSFDADWFLDQGVVSKRDSMENLLKMTVQKTILAPEQLKRGELETLDPEVLNHNLSKTGISS